MFKNISGEVQFSGGTTSASSPGHGVASSGHDNQESPWISMFSVMSRPALSFLQRYLPGRSRTPVLSDNVTGWVSGGLKHRFVDEERAILGQLNDLLPLTQHSAPSLAYLRCQHDDVAGLQSGGDATLSWLTSDSLHEIGIQNAADMDIRQQPNIGYFSTARNFLSHFLLGSASAQEMKRDHVLGGKTCPVKSDSSSKNWWGGFWGTEESSQSWLSDLSLGKEGMVTSEHCPQTASGTKAVVAKTTELFVQCSSRESIPGESAGHPSDKEEPTNNGSLQPESLPSSEVLTVQQSSISISSHVGAGAAPACNEAAILTPDQDNGYSSLEEEHIICRLYMVKVPFEQESQGVAELKGDTTAMETEGEISEDREEGAYSAPVAMEVEVSEEEMEESGISGPEDEGKETSTQEGSSAAAMLLTTPQCQNKTIAYIMGSPCSDDDSQSDKEFSEDDDGFDSEGSSELSDSSGEDSDDSDSDNEADSEAERLWNSLCQSQDPYNPQNFTARIHTSVATPRTIPTTSTSAPSCSPHSSAASSPNQSPLSSSPTSLPSTSSPRDCDTWDESTSASETEEAESLRLWNSFSSCSDPYSPLNFQASLRTRGSAKVESRTGGHGRRGHQTPLCSPHHAAATAASPPQYRKEEAEDRLDSGFSEPLASTVASTATPGCMVKKVRFCEEVEEFFASCGEEEEDRRGPWEELARDRYRFLRRCQEVELSITYCLEPQHRHRAYQRLTVWSTQDS
ncbi:uncharacterized protein ppp1r15b [Polymixia lowei]